MLFCFNGIFDAINYCFPTNNNKDTSYMNCDEIYKEKELRPKNLFIIGNNRNKVLIDYVNKLEKTFDRICVLTDDLTKNRKTFNNYLDNMNFTLVQWDLDFMISIYEYQKFININSLKLNNKGETMLLIFDCLDINNFSCNIYNLINEISLNGCLAGITLIVTLPNNMVCKLNLKLYEYIIVSGSINNDKVDEDKWKTSLIISKEELIQLYSKVMNDSDILINLSKKKVWLINDDESIYNNNSLEEQNEKYDKILLEIMENNSCKAKLIKNICSENLSNEYVYISLILGAILDN